VSHSQQGHFAFEYLLFESFRARDTKNSHWADGLLHVVPHEQVPQVALHHQHAQYHQVLFWLENLFPQAAQWLGVRELARLALDFLENNPFHSEEPLLHAQKLIEILSKKRSHLHVAQLEALMRCGIAVWKVRSGKWRPDIAMIPRERPFSFMALVEHNQAAYVESSGEWSIFNLWQSAQTGKAVEVQGDGDVLAIFRKDELSLEFECWTTEQLKERIQS